MNPLDDELKRALQRKEPSADFEGRVMRRIRSLPPPGAQWWEKVFSPFRLPQWRWAAAAAMVCLGAWLGVAQYQKEQEARLQGEKAKDQVMLALHIASTKLNVAQKAVLERNAHVSQP
jgi:negative regulator of sigma E activity